jgi:drug/metabolite transporter (DMT)-like permease
VTAILLAFASATFFGAGVVITQFGLRHIHPLSGAAVSIPVFTTFFVLVSPILLHGDHIVWRAIPIFAAIGLVFPGLLTLLTFASNRALGPVVTSALGNVSPLFSVALAVLILGEPLQPVQFAGIIIAVIGVLTITLTAAADARDWGSWVLLLPLSAAFIRGVMPPFIKIGLEIWPNPVGAGLTGYIFSSLTVLTVERVRNGSFIVKGSLAGRLWFAVNGMVNGIATLLLYAAVGAGRVTTVAPLIATYPLITTGLSALVLTQVRITARLASGTALAVAGIVLILIG